MDPVTLGLCGVTFGFALVYGVIKERERRRRLAALPPVATIATAQPGAFVRIVGKIVEGGALNAPITGRVCVGFSATVHPLRQMRDAREWLPASTRVGSTPFVVDDGTGRIDVEPGGLEIRAAVDHHVVERRRTAFVLHDPSMLPDWLHFDEVILDEGSLRIGARVVLEGVVQRSGDAERGAVFRADASPAQLVASSDRSASVSNLPANVEEATRHLRVARSS